ncbi:hypothetical protein PHYBOEH_005802 [Phytophthora boehmeriae]|uniref:Elicitin n=1 Tax=Phytophthora boehmeriae TaxID=109152 RepID=A0A8T1X2W1_9STRA|nr:hypothetical protein PHYBOEH_005802 [Phytophthora boehmeriae]
MKTVLVSALGLLVALVAAANAPCDLAAIKTKLEANATTLADVQQAEQKCLDASGINIFNLTTFPTTKQAKAAQGSGSCSKLVNYINANQNIDSQCTVTLGNKTIIYGRLISDFLDGKTGNESDSGSGSIEAPSDSGSSESGSNETSKTPAPSTSGSGATALSFVAYGAIAAIAAALH